MIVHVARICRGRRTALQAVQRKLSKKRLCASTMRAIVVRLRRRVPLVELERAAEDDAVGAREHVAGAAGEGIADLRLRLEDGELAARRMQVLVAEQVAAAEAGAVEDERFGQRRDIGGRREPPDLDLAAGDLHVADHLAEIAAGLDVHACRSGGRSASGNGCSAWLSTRLIGGKVGNRLRLGAVALDIGRQPANAVIVADHDLEAPPAIVERAGELRHELGRDLALVKNGERMELAAGDVRRRVGRKRGGVDRDRKARLLHQPRGRQAHRRPSRAPRPGRCGPAARARSRASTCPSSSVIPPPPWP